MIREYIEREYGIKTATERPGLVSIVHTSPIMLFRYNPNRFMLIVVNLSVNNMYLGFDAEVSSTNGILIDAGGGFLILNLKDDLYLVQKEIWLVSTAVDSNIYAFEAEAIA